MMLEVLCFCALAKTAKGQFEGYHPAEGPAEQYSMLRVMLRDTPAEDRLKNTPPAEEKVQRQPPLIPVNHRGSYLLSFTFIYDGSEVLPYEKLLYFHVGTAEGQVEGYTPAEGQVEGYPS